MQDGVTAHALGACDHIGDHVVAHVPHVQASRGIGKHREGVKRLLAWLGLLRRVEVLINPALLPVFFKRCRLIALGQPRSDLGIGGGLRGRHVWKTPAAIVTQLVASYGRHTAETLRSGAEL